MKKIILLVLLSLYIGYSNAQPNTTDSLKLLLQNEKTDTSRVMLLATLSFEYVESKPDTTMALALEAMSLADRIGFLKGQAASLNRIGTAYIVLGNYSKAMEVFLQALKINEKLNNYDGIQRNNNNIGTIYYEQGDYRQAFEYFFRAKNLAEKLNDQQAVSIALINIGDTYYRLKNFDSARVFTQLANNVASGIHFARMIGNSFRLMGDINFETGQHKLALEYYRLSIPHLQTAVQDASVSETLLGIAKVFEKTGENDSVLLYAKKALLLARETGFNKNILEAGKFLSGYYRKFNADSAFFYQDIFTAAKDSLFSQQSQRQLQSLAVDEKIRQHEIVAATLKAKEERKHNLQYAAIALGLITFVILFLLLSHSIIANQKLIRFFGVVALLLVFEFINLYIGPYVDRATNHSPLLILLVMVCIAAMLVPVHNWLEKLITNKLVEKNKKIRLAAAKKTIAKLEGEQTN